MPTRVFEALNDRFDDIDEVRDISNHGCSGGVNGFIYTWELREFFFKYEDEIEEHMYELDVDYPTLCGKQDCPSISDYITAAVWWVVENWCVATILELEEAMDEEYALANAY